MYVSSSKEFKQKFCGGILTASSQEITELQVYLASFIFIQYEHLNIRFWNILADLQELRGKKRQSDSTSKNPDVLFPFIHEMKL